jgi:hypothetical protein
MYGRPTAAELVAVVADFLDNDVRAATGPDSRLAPGPDSRLAAGPDSRLAAGPDSRLAAGPDSRLAAGPDSRLADVGHVNFHARVAANVLRIVERELLDGSAADVTEALASLGYADEAQLAAAVRAGDLDDRPDAVLACLRTIVRRRLDVAHPGYAEQ